MSAVGFPSTGGWSRGLIEDRRHLKVFFVRNVRIILYFREKMKIKGQRQGFTLLKFPHISSTYPHQKSLILKPVFQKEYQTHSKSTEKEKIETKNL